MIVVANNKKINPLDPESLLKKLNLRIEEGFIVWDYDKNIDNYDVYEISVYDFSLQKRVAFLLGDFIDTAGLEIKDSYINNNAILIGFNFNCFSLNV